MDTSSVRVNSFNDFNLRPTTLDEYIGQVDIKKNLAVVLESAQKRQSALEHVFLAGPPGLGKTTLAALIAKELGSDFRITSGPALERGGDVASLLMNLQPNDVLFIDEIHRLNRSIEEMLYPAMEDFCLDLMLGKGPTAKSMRLEVPPFTLIGATTKPGALSAPLRDRFGLQFYLDYYSPTELKDIISRSARVLGVSLTPEAAELLATRSRRTPRIANRLTRRVRDFALVRSVDHVTPDFIKTILDELQIDAYGLDHIDRRILNIIINDFSGGPVGVETLVAATSIERATLEDVYEPYLMQIGFLDRTNRGRMATSSAIEHLK